MFGYNARRAKDDNKVTEDRVLALNQRIKEKPHMPMFHMA